MSDEQYKRIGRRDDSLLASVHVVPGGCGAFKPSRSLVIEAATEAPPKAKLNSGLRAALDRRHLFGVEPLVDPISPMLHQLRARADQRERSVPFVQTFHSRVIDMRELQLDDIAIPSLGVLDLFVMRQGREGGAESVGTMISLGVNAEQPQALVQSVV